MPWKIEKRNGKHCVIKEGDGSVEKCHMTAAQAKTHMRALYASESKETEEKALGEPETAEVSDADHVKMYDEPMGKPSHGYVPWGVTTFAELMAYHEEQDAATNVHELTDQFQQLLDNVMRDEGIEDKAAGVEALATEFSALVRERMANPESEMKELGQELEAIKDEDDETTLFERFKEWLGKAGNPASGVPQGKPADDKKPEPDQGLGFMIWKEADGSYRWMARYSNNFRDQDTPPEIISSRSHQRFDQLLSKGEAPMPELWLWHRPEWRWGQATWHAYDDAGFALAAGVVSKEAKALAEHLMALDPALVRVSHGMPTQSIARDPDDPSVIVEHVTREISPLPAWAAANQRTGFIILKEMNDMAIPQDKREALQGEWNLSDELLTQLEAANVADAKEADEAGVEKKEVETTETPQAQAEVPAEAAPESPAPEVSVSREEMREALVAVGQAIAALSGQVKELQGQVVEVKETQAVEEAETLSELFERAIKRPETRVDGRLSEAKDRPAETKAGKPGVVNSGHPLADHVINNIVSGDFLAGLRGPQQTQ